MIRTLPVRKAASEFKNSAGLTVVESIYGTWYYHLRIAGQHDALCGNGDVMPTSIPVEAWGTVEKHIGERYCVTCEELA